MLLRWVIVALIIALFVPAGLLWLPVIVILVGLLIHTTEPRRRP